MTDWNNPVLRNQSERRLQSENVFDRGRTGNRTIRFGPDRGRAKIRRRASTRAGTRAPRCVTQIVSIFGIAAARAPTDGEWVGKIEAAKVCPLAEIRFAE